MLFSVVIPTYNRAHTIKRALDSVFSQSFGDFEIVVVDDGSTDNTKEILRQYTDSRLRVVSQANSGLPAKARNRGIQEARGEWTAFLDSDDYWLPAKLEHCYQAIEKGPLGLVAISHWEDLIKGGSPTEVLKHGSDIPSEFLFERLLFLGNCFSTSAMVIRSRTLRELEGFDSRPEFFIVEDYDLWLRLAHLRKPVVSLKEILGAYTFDGDNISKDLDKMNENLYQVLSKHIDNLKVTELTRALLRREARSRTYYFASRAYYKGHAISESLDLGLRSIRTFPLGIKKWVHLLQASAARAGKAVGLSK